MMKKLYIVKNKESFIRTLPPLTNAKIMTLTELEQKILGSYDNEARTYLYLEKHIDLNMIDVYLSALKFIGDTSTNKKISFLSELKKELINKSLYFYDEIFINSLKNYEVIFIDYLKNKHITKIINLLEKYTKVNFIEATTNNDIPLIHEYRYLEDELNDVIYKVMTLVKEGKPLNNIKLMNVNTDYYASLSRILNQYHLPFISLYDTNIATSNYGIKFIKNMNELGVNEALKLLNNDEYDSLILSVVNSYAYLDNIDDAKKLIEHDLKLKSIPKTKKDVYLELVPLNYQKADDDYIFFLNLNNGVAPRIYENNDYLSDEEYTALGELTSAEKTFNSERETLLTLSKVDYISYKLVGAFDSYLPSYIISKYDLKVIKEASLLHETYYSDEIESYNYALSRDHFFKTKIKDSNYDFLKYNFEDNITNKDYSFSGIDINKFHDYMNHNISLSYSKLNDYFSCHFAYYLKYILKINNYQNTLPTIRGNVFHKLLEKKDDVNFDYDTTFENEINRFKETDNKIHFFTSLIKDEFNLVSSFNDALIASSSLKDTMEEYNVEINKQINDMNIKIVGYIDKIMYNNKACMLIDYKSGSVATFHLDLLYYGLNIQLPMYAYYMKYDPKFKNHKIAGLYLEYIYHSFTKKDLLDPVACAKKYKLTGYNNDLLIDELSSDYSRFFVKSNKLSNYTVEKMVDFTEQKVDEAINDIVNAKFDINPSVMKKYNHDSCAFCEFHDICHFKDKKRVLENKEVKDFLGGE